MRREDIYESKRNLLDQIENKRPIDMGAYSLLRSVFENASHDGLCPCQSGKIFRDCCKLDWVCIRGIEEKEKVVASESKTSEEKEEPIWLFKIGQVRNGAMALAVTDEGKRIPQIQLAEMLLNAYHVANYNAVMTGVQGMLKSRPQNVVSLKK